MRNRIKEIPKGNGKVRTLGIPGIRDCVVQGALKLIIEAIFEADFQEGSYGYRPKRTAHAAIVYLINPVLAGWANCFRVGNSLLFAVIAIFIPGFGIMVSGIAGALAWLSALVTVV